MAKLPSVIYCNDGVSTGNDGSFWTLSRSSREYLDSEYGLVAQLERDATHGSVVI